MPISGKYDFKGISKMGAVGLRAAFSMSPYTAWINKFGALADLLLEFVSNWLANRGLVILNVGANYVNGVIDVHQLDKAFDSALDQITIKGGRDKLTAAEKKAIDDEVIKKARELIVINKPK